MTLGPILFARSRLDRRTSLYFLLANGTALMLCGRTFRVPVVPWDVTALTSPLVPVAAAIVALRPFDTPLASLELAAGDPRRAALARCAWFATCLVAVGGSQGLVSLVADGGAWTGVRNALLYWTLGLLSGWLIGVDLCWVAPTLFVTALLFFGRTADQAPFVWALPLRESGSGAASALTAASATLAGLLYGWQDVSLGRDRKRGSP